MLISSTLKNWYLQKKRDLPWRNTQNPYHIWVSEIILQQTRIAQGIGYYERFISRFPDIETLANAKLDDVLKIWQGLGYYSRARNLHQGAQFVLHQYSGIMPCQYEKLLEIKGIGAYTAAAIGSIVYNLPYPAIDGNASRVLSRVFGIHEPINTTEGVNQIKKLAFSIIDIQDPGLFNQALMEFGSLQCKPQIPDCSVCPLRNYCYAWNHEETNILPIKLKTQKIRSRYFNYLVIMDVEYQSVFITQRSEEDIWKGLYEFPLIETAIKVESDDLRKTDQWKELFGTKDFKIEKVFQTNNYKLTHQIINATYYLVTTHEQIHFNRNMIFISYNDIDHYPVSRLTEIFLTSFITKNNFKIH